MALNTVPIPDGLNRPHIGERFYSLGTRLNFGWWPIHCLHIPWAVGNRGVQTLFMTTDTRNPLARLEVGQGTHRLIGKTILVKCLEQKRVFAGTRNRAEPSGSIGTVPRNCSRVFFSANADRRIHSPRESFWGKSGRREASLIEPRAHIAQALIYIVQNHLRRSMGHLWKRHREIPRAKDLGKIGGHGRAASGHGFVLLISGSR